MRFHLNPQVSRRITAAVLAAALLFALALASSPQLHARLHKYSNPANHECAVTLIASGSYEHSAPPVLLVAPQPATSFASIPTFKLVWVEAPFLGASIFEHAPPVVS